MFSGVGFKLGVFLLGLVSVCFLIELPYEDIWASISALDVLGIYGTGLFCFLFLFQALVS